MMETTRRNVLRGLAAVAVFSPLAVAGCTSRSTSGSGGSSSGLATATGSTTSTTGSLAMSNSAWRYDTTNDVYYQLGRTYVADPQAEDYESLGVYVPGKYFTGTRNSDGTYTVKIDRSAKVAGYTADSAPIVFPVNTPGYAAQKPPTSYRYSDVSSYIEAGFVYVAAGLRGRDSETSSYTGNAPWGVTDLKAAVRYVRYNAAVIPGHKDRIFVFGMSGGGAQSAVMGSSGDSTLYKPYLKTLGAAMTDAKGRTVSDAIAGVMAWCPITSLDFANAAYEWNMGQFASTGTRAAGTWTKAYSTDLAAAFARYTNKLRLRDSSGAVLTLARSSTGQYLSGSYYDHLVSVVNTSLNDFLEVTTFPYTPSSAGGPGGGSGGPPGGTSGSSGGSTSGSSTTYKTVQAYIDHLNSDTTWVRYDAATKKATVLSLEGFVTSQKNASKDVGAFDGVSRQQTENTVLGLGTSGLHFAAVSRAVIAARQHVYAKLSGWTSSYAASAYTHDFAKADSVGTTVATRLDMYNPMYFLSRYYAGYQTSKVAAHWRIRTGIAQGDTANTVEINLALALANLGINNVDFATVWGQGHTMAERSGNATTNFIAWVNKSVK